MDILQIITASLIIGVVLDWLLSELLVQVLYTPITIPFDPYDFIYNYEKGCQRTYLFQFFVIFLWFISIPVIVAIVLYRQYIGDKKTTGPM